MAKKKQETGPGTGMIVTLVFFVLASLILGVTTYMGFDGQKELEDKEATAKKEAATARDQAADERARKNVYRVALATADEGDYGELAGASGTAQTAMLDEHNKLVSKLGKNALPTPDAFQWPIMNAGAAPGEGKLAAAPKKTIPAITNEWAKMYAAKKNEADALTAQLKQANDRAALADLRLQEETTKFNNKLAAENKRVTDAIADYEKKFAALKTVADQKGIDFKKFQDVWSEEKAAQLAALEEEKQNVKSWKEKTAKALSNEQSDLDSRFKKLDLARLDSRKGQVVAKGDTFVTLRFDSRLALVPGQSFVVIPPTGSLVEVLEREAALDKRHREYESLKPRDPFTDNEMIKGTVEVTTVTGPYTAEARITYQPNALRNPISKQDQVFNIALSTLSSEHVAFAGIIDLDGDGLPNNEEFIRILEKNGVVIDSYLDIKTGEERKRGNGMNLRTKFMIIGTDAPITGKIAEMQKRAKELGVQQIDAARFLALIGIKPPANPAPPAYNTRGIELGKDEYGLDKDKPAADPKAPAGDPKKEDK